MKENYPSRKHYKERRHQRHRENRIFNKMPVRLAIVCFIFGMLLTGIFGFTALAYVKGAPKLNAELLQSPQSSTIYDMNNNKMIDVAGEEYRKTIPLDEIPLKVQHAFLAVEDARFWEHRGIDFKRVGGAVVANVTEGFGVEGASTITQQLVKRSFLSPEKTIERKVQEAYLSLKLEREYTKKEILEMYLNKMYFGEGAYGVATAADVYFGKEVKDLTVGEAALLAGLLQRPSGYNPYKQPDLAEKRRDTVLQLMNKHGFISEKEKKEAQSIAVKDLLTERKRKNTYNSFTDRVIEELKEKGISEDELYTQGLKIYTTFDPEAQEITEKVLMTDEYIDFPDDEFKAGVVLIETQTGEVRAIGGNRNLEKDIQRGFNYATQLKRQPGSVAKPIMAYGPAIEKFKWPTNEQIKDEEIELNGKVFKNWNNRFHGNVSIRTALQWSYNIPAIKAMMAAGPEEAQQFAEKLGIQLDEVYPAYAIGGFKEGVSPLEIAGAYAAFGNEGLFNEPHTVRKVVYPNGKEVNMQPKPVRAMSDYTAYVITDMLKGVVTEGTGQMANIQGLPIAGKTGTNELPDDIYGDGVTDAWFAGYTTRYSAAVWTGYDKISQDSFVRSKDAHNAKLIFKHIMSEVSEGLETPDFPMPASVEKVMIGNRVELFPRGAAPKRIPADVQKPQKNNEAESKQKDLEEEEAPADEMPEEDQEQEEPDQQKPEEADNKEKKENKLPDQPKQDQQIKEPSQQGSRPPQGNNKNNNEQNKDKATEGNNKGAPEQNKGGNNTDHKPPTGGNGTKSPKEKDESPPAEPAGKKESEDE